MIQAGRRARGLACAAGALTATAFAIRLLPRARRVVVEGESMLPTLEPGDRLLVLAARGRDDCSPRVGDLVVAADPRDPARTVVKRVGAVDVGRAELVGDNPDASTDSRVFGSVAISSLQGRAVYRYAPAARSGWLGRGRRSAGRGLPPGRYHRR